MLRNSLKAAWAHKRRMVSTTIAVLLGVAFMSGTLVLSDTLDRSFTELFVEVLAETDAEVRGEVIIDSGFGPSFREPVDESVIDVIAGIDGVEAVGPYVEASGIRLLDSEGEQAGSNNGPPTLLQSFIEDPALSGIEFVDGGPPTADDEIIMNIRAARDADLDVGDTVELFTTEGTRSFELTGTYQIGGRDSALGAITLNVTLPVAQELNGQPGTVTSISARASGISQEELVSRIEAALGPDNDLVVFTGEEMAQEISDDVAAGFGFFSTILLVFAFIALIVGAFIIYNTFSILVAQRGKELALLRALGASRRQVMVSVLVEALAIGLIAAIIGIGIGIGLAIGVLALLGAIGLDLPAADVAVTPITILTALITGVVVTIGSALVPAFRATRVAPLAALRDIAHDDSGRSIVRLVLGVLLLIVAAFSAIPAFGDDPDTGATMAVGLSAFTFLLALVVLGPLIARPLSKLIGFPLPRLRGTMGHLARENAARSPKRTASTAAALMIGVGLISFIYIFVASARTSVDAELTRGLNAEYIAQTGSFDLGLPLTFAEEIREVEGVRATSSIQGYLSSIRLPDGESVNTFASAIDPSVHALAIDATMAEGTLEDLVPGTMLVDRRAANDRDLAIGDEVGLVSITGKEQTFTISAIGDDPQLLGGAWIITQDDWADLTPTITDATLFVITEPDADLASVRAGLDEVAEGYPVGEIQDQEEFLGGIASDLNTLLNVVLGLLALSVLISLIGIANTLSLSIHERTRELGLLRAVGMARYQVRSAVRWEAVIISLIGTVLGLILGLVTSYLLIEALKSEGLTQYEIPLGSLAIIAVVFAALGVVASLLPARRASKLDVLEAIATE